MKFSIGTAPNSSAGENRKPAAFNIWPIQSGAIQVQFMEIGSISKVSGVPFDLNWICIR